MCIWIEGCANDLTSPLIQARIACNQFVASWKDRKEFAASLKPIYQAASADAAATALYAFAEGPWGQRFPTEVAM